MNKQTPKKRSTEKSLLVHSIFYTIQGEGPFSGRDAVFVRLEGCNLQCPGCDTEYTDESVKPMTWQLLRDKVNECFISNGGVSITGCPTLVVITGGEPMRQNIVPIINALHQQGTIVQIETNGSMPFQNYEMLKNAPMVVCSPKTTKLNPTTELFINAYKYPIDHKSIDLADGLPLRTLQHNATPKVARPRNGYQGDVYITPMDMQGHVETGDMTQEEADLYYKKNMVQCVTLAKTFGYIVQLQIHKLLEVE